MANDPKDKSQKQERTIKVLVINIIITFVSFVALAFSLVGVFVEEGRMPQTWVNLSPYIVILSVLTTALVWLFDRLSITLSRKYDTNVSEANKNYGTDVDRFVKHISESSAKYSEGIIATLLRQAEVLHGLDADFREFVLKRLNDYLFEKNTGPLESSAYYPELHKLANRIIEDKKKEGDNFSGEIWAQSSLLEDEWVTEGGEEVEEYEAKWCKRMEAIDAMSIPTKRLYVFSKKNMDLLKGKISEGHISPKDIETLRKIEKSLPDGHLKKTIPSAIEAADDFELGKSGQVPKATKKLLKKLRPYLIEGSNTATHSFVISESTYDSIQDARNLLGAGYFAVKFTSGRLVMIRDVCPSRAALLKLVGSVDCDGGKLEKAFSIRNSIITNGSALALKEFLAKHCSDRVKEYLDSDEFKDAGGGE